MKIQCQGWEEHLQISKSVKFEWNISKISILQLYGRIDIFYNISKTVLAIFANVEALFPDVGVGFSYPSHKRKLIFAAQIKAV